MKKKMSNEEDTFCSALSRSFSLCFIFKLQVSSCLNDTENGVRFGSYCSLSGYISSSFIFRFVTCHVHAMYALKLAVKNRSREHKHLFAFCWSFVLFFWFSTINYALHGKKIDEFLRRLNKKHENMIANKFYKFIHLESKLYGERFYSFIHDSKIKPIQRQNQTDKLLKNSKWIETGLLFFLVWDAR